jgi:hypothetical protein
MHLFLFGSFQVAAVFVNFPQHNLLGWKLEFVTALQKSKFFVSFLSQRLNFMKGFLNAIM